jgi:hypothetical protein
MLIARRLPSFALLLLGGAAAHASLVLSRYDLSLLDGFSLEIATGSVRSLESGGDLSFSHVSMSGGVVPSLSSQIYIEASEGVRFGPVEADALIDGATVGALAEWSDSIFMSKEVLFFGFAQSMEAGSRYGWFSVEKSTTDGMPRLGLLVFQDLIGVGVLAGERDGALVLVPEPTRLAFLVGFLGMASLAAARRRRSACGRAAFVLRANGPAR